MVKLINGIFSVLKMILLLVCFVFTFYIIVKMYQRLNKDLIQSIHNFVPFVLLFIAFAVNFVLKQKAVNHNIFYNITCCLVFGMILFAVYRTLYDKNMVMMIRMGYNMNFNYFADILAPIKVMLYGLFASNILLMLTDLKILQEDKRK